jgi:hypothetical protein
VNICTIGTFDAEVGVVDTQMAIQIKDALDVTGQVQTR